jgi:glycosyltransferase involved in cell wall biosynthesis
MDLSVIICTHNPRPDYLGRVLNALREQTLPRENWELLLVDNASNSNVASKWDFSWHPNARCIVENELGLAFARKRGMREASADVLVFVDDDNVVDPAYLSEAFLIKQNWPLLGVWGSGATIPEFEVDPPKWLSNIISGERNIKNAYWSNVPNCSDAAPWGAGFCVRSKVAEAYCMQLERSSIKISDRQGQTLWGGGDAEICFVACNAGFGMGVFPQLRLTHLISKGRLTKSYMLKFTEGLTASATLLEYNWGGVTPRSPLSVRGILSMLKNVLVHRGIERSIHFARWRGAIRAKRIIDATESLQ